MLNLYVSLSSINNMYCVYNILFVKQHFTGLKHKITIFLHTTIIKKNIFASYSDGYLLYIILDMYIWKFRY